MKIGQLFACEKVERIYKNFSFIDKVLLTYVSRENFTEVTESNIFCKLSEVNEYEYTLFHRSTCFLLKNVLRMH